MGVGDGGHFLVFVFLYRHFVLRVHSCIRCLGEVGVGWGGGEVSYGRTHIMLSWFWKWVIDTCVTKRTTRTSARAHAYTFVLKHFFNQATLPEGAGSDY